MMVKSLKTLKEKELKLGSGGLVLQFFLGTIFLVWLHQFHPSGHIIHWLRHAPEYLSVWDGPLKLLVFVVILQALLIIAHPQMINYMQFYSRMKKFSPGLRKKVGQCFDTPIKSEYFLTPAETTDRLTECLNRLPVKTADTRWACWVPVCADSDTGTRYELRYTNVPIGRKKSQIYPRSLSMTSKVEGKGMRSNVELTFHAESPSDYANACNIVRETNQAVAAALGDSLLRTRSTTAYGKSSLSHL